MASAPDVPLLIVHGMPGNAADRTRISTVPTIILAWAFGWTPRSFFAAEVDETARPEIDPASDLASDR